MHMHPRHPILHAGLALALTGSPLAAENTPPPSTVPAKKPKKEDIPSAVVVVSATRTERAEKETTATVTVTTDREIERRLVTNIIDLTRTEPGVEVAGQPDRKGPSSFNIRGIGGNRVLILVDGVNLPDGAEASRGLSRDYVDLDSLKRMEILRGSGSALYGSDALAGVVTYTTLDASDLLSKTGSFAGRIKTGYASASNQKAATTTLAGRQGSWDGILVVTRREGNETTPAFGVPNAMTAQSSSLLAKLGWQPSARHRMQLAFQGFERENKIFLNSLLGPALGAPGTFIADDRAKDRNRRAQFNFEHVFEDDAAFLQRIEWRVFYQSASSLEHTDEFRETRTTTPYTERVRLTDYTFDQNIWGLRSQAERRFTQGGWAHRLLFGLDLNRTETSEPYDRTQITFNTGAVTKNVAGQLYPIKLIPDSRTTTTGIFVQNEMLSPSGVWSIVPGLRFDRYELNPRPDAVFTNGNTLNAPVASIQNSAVSPKLGVIGKLDGTWTVYTQYAQGFRNPPYDYTNMTLTSFAQDYRIIPNPSLKPEHSHSYELGLRGDADTWNLSFALFQNRYTDFITDVNLGPDPVSGVSMTFQYQNIQDVRIQGAELRAGCIFLDGWRSGLNVGFAKGENGRNHAPINSVAPMRSSLELGYRRGDRWGTDATLTAVSSKKQGDVALDPANGYVNPYLTPGYAKLDLMGFVAFKRKGELRLQGGLFNALNKGYWRWEDVRGFQNGDASLQRYSQPGRHFGVSLTYSWQ
ncbi:MAG: TonB-dependent hemoglobin/transferrin/lactoferrin family receptor [Acidobacteria bacterium]|nr:TonB-dependent hemoglobin/transferrin/lactoferrin family receptor [Acidobacteriota bacterium]MBI3487150.1 TonB-dependent hemoglobin/transferrin/lactoferrin family receptor [Acidobacteriota bacterium]